MNDPIDSAIVELQHQLDIVKARREQLAEGSFDPDLAESACGIGRAIATLDASRRAREKAAAREAEKMTPAIVMAWIERQPDNVKQHMVRLIGLSMRDGKSVLG